MNKILVLKGEGIKLLRDKKVLNVIFINQNVQCSILFVHWLNFNGTLSTFDFLKHMYKRYCTYVFQSSLFRIH